jgi:large subunit ribosomal protein L22
MEAPVKKLTRKEKIAQGVEKAPKRKRHMAEMLKEARTTSYHASLMNFPTSPRKMRMVADLIRGVGIDKALAILKFNPRVGATPLSKLILSAVASWKEKNQDNQQDESLLFVKEIHVDEARQLKRMRPAPQGRGYRIRKRSNHVFVRLDTKSTIND